jgi:hypothetical protein
MQFPPTTVVHQSPLFVCHEGFDPILTAPTHTDKHDDLPTSRGGATLFIRKASLPLSQRASGKALLSPSPTNRSKIRWERPHMFCKIDPTSRIVSVNQTPGRSKEHTPYRAEVGGILGMVRMLTKICDEHDIQEGQVTLGCDCESALTTIIFEHDYSMPTQANADLISQTRHYLSCLTVVVDPKKIRAHQDDKRPLRRLSPWELLNVEMDRIAKSYWQALQYFPVQYFDPPRSPLACQAMRSPAS